MLWSLLCDEQLIGRIWRHPQLKNVHIYRIIAANTQDVFLNNISFSKGAIHDAFTGATPGLSEFLFPPSRLLQRPCFFTPLAQRHCLEVIPLTAATTKTTTTSPNMRQMVANPL
jgi:hypothetical protein